MPYSQIDTFDPKPGASTAGEFRPIQTAASGIAIAETLPLIAKQMVEFDIIFAGFLPCRIAVVEDAAGRGWIITMNMDMMLYAVDLPEHLRPLAQKVRDTIYSIVDAGVNGDL